VKVCNVVCSSGMTLFRAEVKSQRADDWRNIYGKGHTMKDFYGRSWTDLLTLYNVTPLYKESDLTTVDSEL